MKIQITCIIALFVALSAFSQDRVRSLRPKYSSKMTVAGYTGGETLTNFPVAVRISKTAIEGFDYDQCSGQDDISFSDENGLTLPFEIECWNPGGESVAWVSIPEISTNSPATFTMNWKHSVKPNESNPKSVWTDYLAVWHMNTPYDASLAANYQTNSAGAFHAKMVGAKPVIANSGKIGCELRNTYAKTSYGDILKIPAPSTNGLNKAGFVISGWSYWSGYSRDGAGYVFEFDTTSSGSYHWRIHVRYNKVAAKFSTGNHEYIGTTYINKDWIHWVVKVSKSGNSHKFEYFINGVNLKTLTKDAKFVNLSDGMTVQTGGTTGRSDELRIQNTAASEDWIKAEYDSMANVDFITSAPAVRRADPLMFILK